MKKFAIAAVAAVVTTASLSSVAEARRRHFGDEFGSSHVKVIIFSKPRCSKTTIIKHDDFGNKVIKIIKKCR